MSLEPVIECESKDGVSEIRLIYDGKRVSGLWVHDLDVRIGTAIVRMGGIGGVGTEEPYRRRGFARRVMEASIEYMRENGYDIAALFGIRNFYEKWGYIPALPEYRITVRTEGISDAQVQHHVVDYTEQYKHAVLKMYNDNNRKRTCAVVRHIESWRGFTKGTAFRVDASVKVLLDDAGEPCGYISFDDTDERTAVAEVGYTTPRVFESLVALIAQRAHEHGHEEAYLTMPPDHPFAVYLRRYDCSITERFAKTGGGMIRIINLESLLAKLTDELSQRLRASKLCQWEGAFGIITDIGSVQMNVKSQRITVEPFSKSAVREVLELPQCKLIQLIVGYRDIATVTLDDDVKVSTELMPLLDALFPLNCPYVWWSDRF